MGISTEQARFVAIFSSPQLITTFDLKSWEQLIRILRGADMLGSFYYFVEKNNLLSVVPDFALAHLISAKRYADRQVQQINSETTLLSQHLARIACQPIFLKGAAYVLKQASNHNGRVMSDIDILVPKDDLQKVENALKQDGWIEKKLDDYDEQYYRRWAHELPPFSHPERGATLDVHHTIIPPITGISIPAELLFEETQKTAGDKHVLSDEMIIIHCIVHLFYNEDYAKSFRDIMDIHLLLQDYEQNKSLLNISQRVNQLGFDKEWYYTLQLSDSLFNTTRLKDLSKQNAVNNYAVSSDFFITHIILPALMPSHELLDKPWNKLSRFVMFLRGHFLKMPLTILLPHFVIKSRRALVKLIMGSHHYEK